MMDEHKEDTKKLKHKHKRMTASDLEKRFLNDPVFYQWTKVIESVVGSGGMSIDDFSQALIVAKELIIRSDEMERHVPFDPTKPMSLTYEHIKKELGRE